MNRVLAVALALLAFTVRASAGQVYVAVAANFTEPAKQIAAAFKARTGDEALLSFGASGLFYSQIQQGAPFEILLSADQERPKKLATEGLAIADSRFTYAVGKLVLWSKSANLGDGAQTLAKGDFAKLAFCNPAVAPYGAAAVETMQALKLYDALKPKLVQGESIAQAFQFVDTGNAELGFVALSQLAGKNIGSQWLAPQEFYKPILQDAVLLKKGAGNPAAVGLLAFLKGPEARATIQAYGYGLEGGQ